MPKRIKPEDYLKRCKERGYDLPVEDYINANTKIRHKCKQGHIYLQSPAKHLCGQGCPKCKRCYSYTPKEYYNLCKEKGLDTPVEDYITTNTKIRHKCKQGHIYKQKPKHHLNGAGCPKCRGNYSYTPKEYYNLCKDSGLDLPVEYYINNRAKIKHKCKQGHVYEQSPHNHLNGAGCSRCSGIHSYTPKEYYSLCKDRGLDLPIENYINTKSKIDHMCNKGHVYKQKPNAHLNGNGCPICNGGIVYTPIKYYNLCNESGLDLPVEDYVNAITKIKHKCIKGHVYNQSPNVHLTGCGCPKCNESHGEKFIRNYLEKNNIKYIPQKKFDDLKDKTYLSYDFYLPEYNILIEYQGIQHYEPRFGNTEYFNIQQLHDKVKRNYAKDAGYKLLELHYSLDTQDKVDKYLSTTIKGSIV